MAPVPQEGDCSVWCAIYSHLTSAELPILESLIRYAKGYTPGHLINWPHLSIRNRLTALKKDRGEFIKSSDVNQLYQAVVKQSSFFLISPIDSDSVHLVTKLNDVRDDNTTYNNRLDTLLADVFSLLSLFYLTIGKTRDTPATYCQIASMRVRHISFQLQFLFQHPLIRTSSFPFLQNCTHSISFQQILNHMNESALYNESDLAPFHRRLNELRQIVQQDSKQPKALTKLLERQLHECGMSSTFICHPLSFHSIYI